MENRCYSVKDVQEILGVSRQCVYALLKRDEFRWHLIGGKYRISRKSFDAWLDDKPESEKEASVDAVAEEGIAEAFTDSVAENAQILTS